MDTMPLKTSRALCAAASLCLAVLWGSAAWAVEDVSWPTYYPSPSGNYQSLNSTRATALGSTAGSVVTLALGGRVGFGTGAPTHVLDVRTPALGAPASANGLHTAALVNNLGVGVFIGSFIDPGGVIQTYGSIQSYDTAGNFRDLALNPGGSAVRIGANSNLGAQTLVVGGAGTIGFQRNGNTGEFKLDYSGGSYHPVFAPDDGSGWVPAS